MKAEIERYRKAKRKKEKSEVIKAFAELCNYNRSYAGYLLRMANKRIYGKGGFFYEGSFKVKLKREKEIKYDEKVKGIITQLWIMFDYICSKRLKAAIREAIDEIDLEIGEEMKEKLIAISQVTISRLLKTERKKNL
ncbi:MAG: hypothetical protein N2445_02730 [Acidobacteria bacterium]|nr:hypothetical protein [Acidobacteriota bacterium]